MIDRLQKKNISIHVNLCALQMYVYLHLHVYKPIYRYVKRDTKLNGDEKLIIDSEIQMKQGRLNAFM